MKKNDGIGRLKSYFAELEAQKKQALVAYLCMGDPSLEDSLECCRAALKAGADILELGVPFSDPTADGPVIAAASYRAIQGGSSLRRVLEVAKILRAETEKPLVLFTYYNPIVIYGEDSFCAAAQEAGIDAMLIVDLPAEEGAELRSSAKAAQLGMIPLLAPTSDDARVELAISVASGFIYYVSMTGVTGSKSVDASPAGARAVEIKALSKMPVVVGFGVDSPAKAAEVAAFGVDGVVIGTAIVKKIHEQTSTAGRVSAVSEFVGSLRSGIDLKS